MDLLCLFRFQPLIRKSWTYFAPARGSQQGSLTQIGSRYSSQTRCAICQSITLMSGLGQC
ncbi:hypothetical protein EU545_05355 [Candidatus Thorarchaeota archaeon]|nr:MAG: hypothetical protein EU545_05355 [Candidatus Thorarchaeota archaeon]